MTWLLDCDKGKSKELYINTHNCLKDDKNRNKKEAYFLL